MDPYFGNRSWYKQPDTHRRSFSHYPPGGAAAHPIQRPTGPKVVQIPVHFVGSEPVDRAGSALKIQKVFRGFLVRKCMKRIKDVKKQVDEIEEKLLEREEVELIRRDERARLRMSEGLMSLLLKLDSIRGFDLGVKDCRKTVIRKVISLQEKIDTIVSVNSGPYGEDAETKDQDPELGVYVETETKDQEPEIKGSMETGANHQEPEVGAFVENHCSNQSSNNGKSEDCGTKLEGRVEMLNEGGKEFQDLVRTGLDDGEIETIVDVGVDREVKVGEADGTRRNVDSVEESFIESDVKNDFGDWDELDSDKEIKGHGCDGNKRNNELMDRMIQDNDKMMNMMTLLFDSNEKQMKMINALAHRVELLEKAFMCDKRRKKKQRKKAASCGDE